MEQRRAAAAGRPRRQASASVKKDSPPPSRRHPAGAVLELQRLAGNKAVTVLAVQRFGIDDAVDAVAAAQAAGDAHDLAWWRDRIAKDKALLFKWDFQPGATPEQRGYMDLHKELVLALTEDAGLLWGGTYKGAKDIMHFDYRGGPIKHQA